MKTKSVLLWAVVLFVIDQVVKVVINRYFIDVKFDIIPPLFYFRPTFNYQYSWVNGLFGLGIGFWAHIIIFGFVAIVVGLAYDYMKTVYGNGKMINIAFVFSFAAVMSGFIGTILWNGCLDYIELKGFFVFDLKDLYINIFTILFFWNLIYNFKHRLSFKNKGIISHFKNRFTSLQKKQNY